MYQEPDDTIDDVQRDMRRIFIVHATDMKWGKSKPRKRHFLVIGGTAQTRIFDFICQKEEKSIQQRSSNANGVGAPDGDSTSDKQRNAVNVRKDTTKYGNDEVVKNGPGVEVRNG